MPYPTTVLESIKYCPLCGELVPEFDYQEEQLDWMNQHRLVFIFVEVLSSDNDYQPSDDEPF